MQDEQIDQLSQRRLIENELIFKKANLAVKSATDKVFGGIEKQSIPLHFYCECSSMACRQKITMTSDEFNYVRQHPDWCLVLKGHSVGEVEKIVEDKGNYLVVEKTNKQTLDEIRTSTNLG